MLILGLRNLSNQAKPAVHLPRNHVSQSTISRDNRSRASISASPTPMAASTRWVGRLGTVMSLKIDHPCPVPMHRLAVVTAGGMVPHTCTERLDRLVHMLSWRLQALGARVRYHDNCERPLTPMGYHDHGLPLTCAYPSPQHP